MLYLCNFLSNEEDKFIIYDKEKDVDEILNSINAKKIEDITFKKLTSDYSQLPILNLDDIVLRMLRPKERTDTRILEELGLIDWISLQQEVVKIETKSSKLSKKQRDIVLNRYQQLSI